MRRRAAVGLLLLTGVALPLVCSRGAPAPAPPPEPPLAWDRARTSYSATISADGLTLSWPPDEGGWLRAQTTGRLSGGVYAWDFRIDRLAGRHIAVGIMLDPPDWGELDFAGILGASRTAWSYDAFGGAVVTGMSDIHKGLPRVRDGGTVSVRLDLKVKHQCVFAVGGVEAPAIKLPEGSVVIPAATLFWKGQSVTLANFRQVE